MFRLKADHDPAVVSEVMAGLRKLDCPGTLAYTVGSDVGLRDGNWSVAIVADFADAESYRGYDADEEHNRLRARMGPMADEVARVQFEVP